MTDTTTERAERFQSLTAHLATRILPMAESAAKRCVFLLTGSGIDDDGFRAELTAAGDRAVAGMVDVYRHALAFAGRDQDIGTDAAVRAFAKAALEEYRSAVIAEAEALAPRLTGYVGHA